MNDSTSNKAALMPFRRYIQFCLVGASGLGVDMLVLGLLASPAGLFWNLTLAKILAAEAAILNNFLWNDRWTFRALATVSNPFPSRWVRFAKFNLICLAGLGLSVLLLNLQVHCLHLNLFLANFIAIVLVSLWNFGLSWHLGWRTSPPIRL